MVKPSVLSVGIGMGVLMLGGSGIAIPTLWSRANRAETRQDELQGSWRLAREARDACQADLKAVEQQLAELQQQFEAEREALAAALESKQTITSELAALQVKNRELMATSGTLALRDQEMATLVQQLEQSRSDHAGLLARQDADATANTSTDEMHTAADRTDPSKDVTRASAEATVAKPAAPDNNVLAADDLLPITAEGTTPAAKPAANETQTTEKPPTATPVRFDDQGWKSVASGVSTRVVYPTSMVHDQTSSLTPAFP